MASEGNKKLKNNYFWSDAPKEKRSQDKASDMHRRIEIKIKAGTRKELDNE